MYITCLDVEGVLVPEIWIHLQRQAESQSLEKQPVMSRL